MASQTDSFINESFRYVSSYLNDKKIYNFVENEEIFEEETILNVLDAGCGNGNNLYSLVEKYGCKGCGIEPSEDAINLLSDKFKNNDNIEFKAGSVHQIPYDTEFFDMAISWSVLHWLGRNEYLQSIGELIRVTSKYLIIMDFVASKDYRTPYHHDDRFFTYKMDFEPLVLGSGIMEKVYERRWWVNPNDETGEMINISSPALCPFLGNQINYHARKMVVFRKNMEILPLHTSDNF